MTLVALLVILATLLLTGALVETGGLNTVVKLLSLVMGLVTAYFALRVCNAQGVAGVSIWSGFTGLWCLCLAFLMNDTTGGLIIRVSSVASVLASFFLLIS